VLSSRLQREWRPTYLTFQDERVSRSKPALTVIGTEPKYDVAISFLAKDEPIAKDLYARLSEVLKVFYFPHNQEDLVGTNGLESMREPFFDSRVVVVLYRDPWGKTPWTGVEETAIGERCLKQGWPGLVFVNLDQTSKTPTWVPTTHVRFGMEAYGMEGLVGVIKARVQEHGGKLVPVDAMSEMRRIQREAIYLADRESLMRDRRWIEDTVHANIKKSLQEVIGLMQKANAEHGFDIVGKADGTVCVMRSGFVSLGIGWHQPIFNRVEDDQQNGECFLRASEFSGTLILPGERAWVMQNPKELKRHKFKVDVSETRDLVWKESGKRSIVRRVRVRYRKGSENYTEVWGVCFQVSAIAQRGSPASDCKSPGPWSATAKRSLLSLAVAGMEQLRSREPRPPRLRRQSNCRFFLQCSNLVAGETPGRSANGA
jgi:hypothetical protein